MYTSVAIADPNSKVERYLAFWRYDGCTHRECRQHDVLCWPSSALDCASKSSCAEHGDLISEGQTGHGLQ